MFMFSILFRKHPKEIRENSFKIHAAIRICTPKQWIFLCRAEKNSLATGTKVLEPFSYLLRKEAKQEEIGEALAVVSNALKKQAILGYVKDFFETILYLYVKIMK